MFVHSVQLGYSMQGDTEVVNTCCIPFCFTNILNSSLQKAGPLSETMTYGSPKAAKVICNLSIVVAAVAPVVTCTSTHLEWLSTISKNIFPRNGPA